MLKQQISIAKKKMNLQHQRYLLENCLLSNALWIQQLRRHISILRTILVSLSLLSLKINTAEKNVA